MSTQRLTESVPPAGKLVAHTGKMPQDELSLAKRLSRRIGLLSVTSNSIRYPRHMTAPISSRSNLQASARLLPLRSPVKAYAARFPPSRLISRHPCACRAPTGRPKYASVCRAGVKLSRLGVWCSVRRGCRCLCRPSRDASQSAYANCQHASAVSADGRRPGTHPGESRRRTAGRVRRSRASGLDAATRGGSMWKPAWRGRR